MNKKDLRAPGYLEHMIQACDKILSYTAGMNHDAFVQNGMAQDAVLRNIEILGEAANNLLECWPDVLTLYPAISWLDIYGMRNRITHGYFLTNLDVVWNVVEVDIPRLRMQIEQVLDSPDLPHARGT